MNIHTYLQGILLPISTYMHFFQSIFATYINIHAYSRYFCCLYLHTCIFARYFFATYIYSILGGILFCYMFTFYSHIYTHLRVNFMLHIHTHLHLFEKQFHAICSHFEKHFRAIFNNMHIGKALDYLSHMYASFERCLPLATYSNINKYMVNNIFTSSRHKESMVQPSPTCSHFHDFLHSKTKAWVPRPKSHLGNYSSSYETAYTLKNGDHMYTNLFHRLYFTKSCTNAIEAFHQALGGRMFRHE